MTGEILSAGGGFLVAVLWFDLMFDVQALHAPRGQPLPEPALASIAAYYRRVTAEARWIALPMGRFVGVGMIVTIAAALVDLFTGDTALVWRGTALALVVAPVVLAARRVLPNAVRLGTRRDPIEEQSRLALEIGRDHVACLVAIVAFLTIQIAT